LRREKRAPVGEEERGRDESWQVERKRERAMRMKAERS
jgi:hypothetical protein